MLIFAITDDRSSLDHGPAPSIGRPLARCLACRVVELEELADLGQPALLDEANVVGVLVVALVRSEILRTPSRCRTGSRSSG